MSAENDGLTRLSAAAQRALNGDNISTAVFRRKTTSSAVIADTMRRAMSIEILSTAGKLYQKMVFDDLNFENARNRPK